MKHLNISSALKLPLDFVTQTAAILARKRVGKTYTASVIAEEMVHAELPFVALDPTGAWWGLRASADGKSEGLPVVIIGGAHGDVPLEATAGKVIADLVVDHPGYYVIDLSQTKSNAEQDRFATDFAERLYRYKEQHPFPLHLFIDEADSFAPQKPFKGQERMLGAFEALVRRGGIRGIGMTMITQRPAVLNKNVLTQIEMLIVLQMTAPQDQNAIDDWVSRNGTKEQRDEMMASLASLKKGDAWFWSPSWLEIFKRVHVRERHTFNSSATPKAGEKVVIPQRLAKVDLEKLGEEIQATIERARADDPKELKRQVAELQKQLQTRPVQMQHAAPRIETKVEYVEKPVLNGEVKEFVTSANALRETLIAFPTRLSEMLAPTIKPVSDSLGLVLAKVEQVQAWKPAPQSNAQREFVPTAPPQRDYQTRNVPTRITSSGSETKLPEGEEKVLKVCAQYPNGATRKQITILAGYKRSTRDAYIARLAQKGLVNVGERIKATEQGLNALGDFEPLPTGAALRQYWLENLPQGEKAIFEIAVQAGGAWISKSSLDDVLPYKRSTRDAYIARLTAREVVEERAGEIRASDELFD